MKYKIIFRLIIWFSIFFVIFCNAFAIPEPCKSICPEMDYTDTRHTTFPYNGCIWEVTYLYRYANCVEPGMCDFYIADIRPISGTNCGNGLDTYILFQNAKLRIIDIEDDTDCEPENGECNSLIAINYQSCWKWDGIFPGPGMGDVPPMVPCDGKACCRDVYKVCRSNEGVRTIELFAHIGLDIKCWNEECFTICEEQKK